MLTTGEVAKLFQVSAQTVINWLDQGRMPYERIGRGPRRLTEETVLNYIKEVGISPNALDQSIYEKLVRRLYAFNQDVKSSAVAIVSTEMSFIGWNDEAHKQTGISSVEILGKPINEALERVEGRQESIDQILKGEWNSKSLEITAYQKSHSGNSNRVNLTITKFYAQEQMAGYAIVYGKKEN